MHSFFFIRKNKIIIKNNFVCGFDISNVIKDELDDNLISYAAAIESILTMRFIKRIQKIGINVTLSIDWFENQINDRGWNYGFNKYYPNINTLGYRGLIPSDLLLSEMFPTDDEFNNKMLPKKICVIGNALVNEIKKYSNKIDVEVAPAFRFQHLWKIKYKPNKSKYLIFVALPINFNDSLFILNLVIEAFKEYKKQNFEVIIKSHPTTSIKELQKNLEYKFPDHFLCIEGKYTRYFM